MAFSLENRAPVLFHANHPSVPVRCCPVAHWGLTWSVPSEAYLHFLLVICVVVVLLGVHVSVLLCTVDSVYWL